MLNMAEETCQYFKELTESSFLHSFNTMASNDDWMTEMEEEDQVSLPLSDEEVLSFNPWERNERELILQNNKDTSIFSSNIDASTEISSPIKNCDVFSVMKSKRTSIVNEREDENVSLGNSKEIIGILNQGEKFYSHELCPVDHFRDAKQEDISCFNFYKNASQKSEMLASHHNNKRFEGSKTSDNLMGISDRKLRGYFGVEGLKLKRTVLEVDKHGCEESNKEERVNKSELSHNPNFLFDTKSRKSDESILSFSDKRKEKLPRFWWLSTRSKYTNENDNNNFALKNLDVEMESSSKNSTGILEKNKVLCKEKSQSVYQSYNLTSNEHTFIQADSSSAQNLVTNSNSYSCVSDCQKSLDQNDFDNGQAWWKDVKRVNLPDFPYGFTQKQFEITMKNIHGNNSKINCSSNRKKNDSVIDTKMPECEFLGNNLSVFYDEDLKKSEMSIKLREAQKNTNDVGKVPDELLNKSTIKPSIRESITSTKIEINEPGEAIEQGGNQSKKDLLGNFVGRTRLENQFHCDTMSIFKVQENENIEREQEVTYDSKLESCNYTLEMRGVISEECSITDQEKPVSEKYKSFVGNDFSHENSAQTESEDASNKLENAEYVDEYDNMLVLEAIKIESEVINESNREKLLESSAEKMVQSLKHCTENSCKENCDSIKVSDYSQKTEVEISIEALKEVSHKNSDFIVIADQKEAKEIALIVPTCKEIKETEEYFVDKFCIDDLEGFSNYCNSSIDVFDKNYTFAAEEKDFKFKSKQIFEKVEKLLDENIPVEQKSEIEVDDNEENLLNKRRLENFIKVEYDLRVTRKELLEDSIGGTKTSHQRDDKCDYLLEEDLCSLNREERLEKEINTSQSMNEVFLMSEVAKGHVKLSKEKDHASKLYEEKQRAFMEFPKNPVSFQSESKREKTLDIYSENVLDIQECLLSEGNDNVLSRKECFTANEETLISEDMAYFSNQDLTNEVLKNLPSSLVPEDIMNTTNSGSLSFGQDQKIVEESLALTNTSCLTDPSSDIKPAYYDSAEALNFKPDLDLNYCFIDDNSEDLCCELLNHAVVVKGNNFSANELLCKIFSYLSDKKSNDCLIKITGSLKECIRSKYLGSLNACTQKENDSPNASMSVAAQTLSSFMRGWNSILMRNVLNMSFVQIQFQNIKMHKATGILLIPNIRKENTDNHYLYNDNQNVATLYKSGRIVYEDYGLNAESLDTPMDNANKLCKSLNDSDPLNFAKVMELDYQRGLVSDCKSCKTAETNNTGNCKVIEKWLLDVEELYNDFSAELYIDRKLDSHYDVMLTKLSLRTNENLMIEINFGVDKNVTNKEIKNRKSNNDLQNSSFRIDMKYKELDKFTKNADKPNYICFHQEYIDSIKTFDEEDLGKNLISDNRKSLCLSSSNETESLNLIEDQGHPFDDESLYNFNPWMEASAANQSQERSVEKDTGHSKSLGSPILIESDDEGSLEVDKEKHEDSQSIYDNKSYIESLGRHSETDEQASLPLEEEKYEDSSLSIRTGEGMVGEEISKYKTYVNRENYDDTSLDSYLSLIIEKHFNSEEKQPILQCGHPEYKTLAAVNAECQTKISGLLDTFHTRTCVDHFILSANEHEICHTYGNKRSIAALNLEVARSKRLKCMDVDNFHSRYDKKQEGEYSENITKKRTSIELDISVGEKKDSPIKKTKFDALEESSGKVLQLEEDEWSEITNDRIILRESLDQKVPDITPMIRYQGIEEEDSKACSRKIFCEENNAIIREVPSVPKISQRTSVLRLGLSKRVRPRPLHKVQ